MILDLVDVDLWQPRNEALDAELADLREYQAIVLARCDKALWELAMKMLSGVYLKEHVDPGEETA